MPSALLAHPSGSSSPAPVPNTETRSTPAAAQELDRAVVSEAEVLRLVGVRGQRDRLARRDAHAEQLGATG